MEQEFVDGIVTSLMEDACLPFEEDMLEEGDDCFPLRELEESLKGKELLEDLLADYEPEEARRIFDSCKSKVKELRKQHNLRMRKYWRTLAKLRQELEEEYMRMF